MTLRSLDGLRRIWFGAGRRAAILSADLHQPLGGVSALGTHPLGYHLVNVLLHALNALLLWRVLRRLRVPGAWLAAAVFALHPMNVESVAWITERKNVLSGAVRSRRAAGLSAGAARRRRRVALAYLARCGRAVRAARCLSKSVTCTLPAVLLLIDWWKRGGLDRRTLLAAGAAVRLGLGMAAMTVWMERYHVGAEGEEWTLSFARARADRGPHRCGSTRAPCSGRTRWPSSIRAG